MGVRAGLDVSALARDPLPLVVPPVDLRVVGLNAARPDGARRDKAAGNSSRLRFGGARSWESGFGEGGGGSSVKLIR